MSPSSDRTSARCRRDRRNDRREHVAIGPRLMNGDEALHRLVQFRELCLDDVELITRVQLAPECVAEVMHAAARAMRDLERAAAWATKRAACVCIGASGRLEIVRTRACVRERGELVVLE